MPKLFSAFAAAESNTFLIGSEADFGVFSRIATALLKSLPLMISRTILTLYGEILIYLATALGLLSLFAAILAAFYFIFLAMILPPICHRWSFRRRDL